MGDVPFHLSASGRVDKVKSDTHTFAMTISQPLNGVIDAEVKIRGVLGLNMNRSLPLPSPGSVISFSGMLLSCEDTVVRVAIKHISVLPLPCPVNTSQSRLRRSLTHAS